LRRRESTRDGKTKVLRSEEKAKQNPDLELTAWTLLQESEQVPPRNPTVETGLQS
jgi:hypothetical protein